MEFLENKVVTGQHVVEIIQAVERWLEDHAVRLVLQIAHDVEEGHLLNHFSSAQVERVVEQLGPVGRINGREVLLELIDQQTPVFLVVVDSIEARMLDVGNDPIAALVLAQIDDHLNW